MTRENKTTKRWPAEWELHERTWMAFPCRKEIWSNGLEKAQLAFSQVANLISEFEPLSMLVNPEHKQFAAKKLNSEIDLIEMPYDDSWLRDTAPIWVRENDELVGLDFEFNGWGEKFLPYDDDQKIAQKIIEESGSKTRVSKFILEGGSIHSNGEGAVLTTKQCLLHKNRNPDYSQRAIEELLTLELGANQIIWLEKGIAGDIDTDGHVDNIACFVDKHTILTQRCQTSSENFDIYQMNRGVINDHSFELVELEEPEARYSTIAQGSKRTRVPLSYINFYIANELVVIPQFGCKQDDAAFNIISELFSDRKSVAVDANEILVGGGGIHCITMHQPV